MAGLTRNYQEVLEAFRRMAFNVFAHNRDDHVKNLAFLLDWDRNEWALSPSYDVCYSAGPGGEHTMTIGGEGKSPGESHLCKLGKATGLRDRDCDAAISQARSAIARWREFAAESNVSQATADLIASKLATK